MKNIQIVVDAEDATYSIFQATEEEFSLIFSMPNQDIKFAEEIEDSTKMDAIFIAIWCRPLLKKDAMGIHGTIFYHASHRSEFYPQSRRMIDMDDTSLGASESQMYAAERERLGVT